MPFRERVAWLSLIAMAITFGPYVAYVAASPGLASAPLPNLPLMVLFAVAMLGQVVVLGAGRLWFRLRWAEDARAKPDERDRAIDRRSIRAAYFVLMAGTILAGIMMPFTEHGWKIVNTAALSIIIAEMTRCAVAVTSYRRGWND